jgi:hypothetical protein
MSFFNLMRRRHFLLSLTGLLTQAGAQECLPRSQTFLGDTRFHALCAQAREGRWDRLPIGERVAAFGQAMVGTPYVGFTLEIDDHVESPSVNFTGLDCWTFFETALALARMTHRPDFQEDPGLLLREIEATRYRGGRCTGGYLERIHYLEEWFRDNHARRNIRDITRELAPVVPLKGRRIDEMTVLWKSYRYLRHNPALRSGMAAIEQELQGHPFHYIPEASVAALEPRLQNGDIIGIVTHKPHVYCSHVGLIVRTQDGAARLMHASSTHRRVIIDRALSGYLGQFKSHAGIIVARPV